LGLRMIGSEEVCVEKIPSRSRFQVHSLQLGKMGRTAERWAERPIGKARPGR
jgi:hypothetical protein